MTCEWAFGMKVYPVGEHMRDYLSTAFCSVKLPAMHYELFAGLNAKGDIINSSHYCVALQSDAIV